MSSSSVTVPGATGNITVAIGTGDVLQLAAQIGALLSTVQGAGNLTVTPAWTADPTGAAENVYRLYVALLNRVPSAAEINSWTVAIDSGQISLTAAANAFVASAEFVGDYGSLSNVAFINQVYQNILGRQADPVGLQDWANALNSGVSRGAVAVGIAESQEAELDTIGTAGENNNGEVYRLYEAAFGRAPDAGGLAAWSALLASGATAAQVAAGIANSSEFPADNGSLSPTAFVLKMYQNTFGRVPSQSELQGWVAALQGGASEASVLLAFANSAESVALTAPVTHANWVFTPVTSGSGTNELLLSGPGGLNTSIPGSNYIVVNDTSADTLSASNSVIVSNGVGGTFFVSGTSTVAATGGDNTVNATGTYELSFGSGYNSIRASGSGTIATGLGSSTVFASNTSGAGNVIDSNGAGDQIFAVSGNNTVNATGSNTTITGGSGIGTIAGGNLTVNVSGPNEDVQANASSATITAGGNSNGLTVQGGTGPLEFVGGTAVATIIGGSGGSTIFGGSNVTFDGSGDLAYATFTNATLNAAAASGNVSAKLLGGADSISLGSGINTITGGSGSETLNGGSGGTHYIFDANLTAGAADFITDSVANIAKDTFSFDNYASGPTPSLVNGALTLTLSDSTTITFTNVHSINQPLTIV